MLLELHNQTGLFHGIAEAGADSRQGTAWRLAGRIHGAIRQCLHRVRRRWRWVPDMEIRHFSLRYDAPGVWILSGARSMASARFRDLAAALSFARDDAGAEAADIELWVDGFYIFVHQSKGWPHRLCGPAGSAARRG